MKVFILSILGLLLSAPAHSHEVSVTGRITSETVPQFKILKAVLRDAEPTLVTIHLDTQGGVVTDFMVIYDILNELKLKGHTLHCNITRAISGGFVIASVCNTRSGVEGAELLWHLVWRGHCGPIDLVSLQREIASFKSIQSKLDSILMSNLGIEEEALIYIRNNGLSLSPKQINSIIPNYMEITK